MRDVVLRGLGTAVPPHVLPQDAVAREATTMFGGRYGDFDRLRPVFETTGIAQRHSVVPISWFREPRDWADRNDVYLRGATDLFVAATQSALRDANLQASDIDAIVTVSSTGIATPSLEAHAMAMLAFRPDVLRVPVFGLGCAGGVSGLAIAADLARAVPERTVLLVAVETCTLSFRADTLTKANIVATALFADGAAAAVLRSEDRASRDGTPDRARSSAPRLRIGSSGQVTWPDTLGIMGWSVDPVGLGAIFSKSIPTLVQDKMRAAAVTFLSAHGRDLDSLRGCVFHPGGTRVIEALEDVFSLPADALDDEREVLRTYGNMSAPTVLFVLDRARRRPEFAVEGARLMAALGPGFTASFVLLEAACEEVSAQATASDLAGAAGASDLPRPLGAL
ncbi:MAG: type III polyketide synthase [Pseudomonadota bacterium]